MSEYTFFNYNSYSIFDYSLTIPYFYPFFLKRLKFGQSIREEGPKSHQKKSGTPTMGGLMIILSIAITSIIVTLKVNSGWNFEISLLLLVLLGFGLLGFLDDFIKVVMKRNLGLNSKQKLLGQIIISIIFLCGVKTTRFSDKYFYSRNRIKY